MRSANWNWNWNCGDGNTDSRKYGTQLPSQYQTTAVAVSTGQYQCLGSNREPWRQRSGGSDEPRSRRRDGRGRACRTPANGSGTTASDSVPSGLPPPLASVSVAVAGMAPALEALSEVATVVLELVRNDELALSEADEILRGASILLEPRGQRLRHGLLGARRIPDRQATPSALRLAVTLPTPLTGVATDRRAQESTPARTRRRAEAAAPRDPDSARASAFGSDRDSACDVEPWRRRTRRRRRHRFPVPAPDPLRLRFRRGRALRRARPSGAARAGGELEAGTPRLATPLLPARVGVRPLDLFEISGRRRIDETDTCGGRRRRPGAPRERRPGDGDHSAGRPGRASARGRPGCRERPDRGCRVWRLAKPTGEPEHLGPRAEPRQQRRRHAVEHC